MYQGGPYYQGLFFTYFIFKFIILGRNYYEFLVCLHVHGHFKEFSKSVGHRKRNVFGKISTIPSSHEKWKKSSQNAERKKLWQNKKQKLVYLVLYPTRIVSDLNLAHRQKVI